MNSTIKFLGIVLTTGLATSMVFLAWDVANQSDTITDSALVDTSDSTPADSKKSVTAPPRPMDLEVGTPFTKQMQTQPATTSALNNNTLQANDVTPGPLTLQEEVMDPNLISRINPNSSAYSAAWRVDLDFFELTRLTKGSQLSIPNGQNGSMTFQIEDTEEQSITASNGTTNKVHTISGLSVDGTTGHRLSITIDATSGHVLFSELNTPQGRYRIITDRTEGKESYLLKFRDTPQ